MAGCALRQKLRAINEFMAYLLTMLEDCYCMKIVIFSIPIYSLHLLTPSALSLLRIFRGKSAAPLSKAGKGKGRQLKRKGRGEVGARKNGGLEEIKMAPAW
jgi:hypothetical protein